eukprot:1006327-Pyramimonas_sp.AAC.1
MCWPRLQRTSATFGRYPLGGSTGTEAWAYVSFHRCFLDCDWFRNDGGRTGPTMGSGVDRGVRAL